VKKITSFPITAPYFQYSKPSVVG